MRRYLNRSLVAAAVILAAGCNLDVGSPNGTPSDPSSETFNLNFNGTPVDVAKMQKTAAGDYYTDVAVGTGVAVNLGVGQQAFISFAGYLKTGYQFVRVVNTLTALNNLPAGLVDGMSGMREGGERIVVVPSSLGYGPAPQPFVPPNSTLVFDVIINQVP